MANSSNSAVTLVGRILVSLVFLGSGLSKVAAFSQMTPLLQSKGLPLPAVALGIAAAIEILGGLAVLAGFQAKIAAWILFVYLIPATLLFHNFWAMQGIERMDNQAHFMKNVAILGGLLLLAASGPGAYSIDGRKGVSS